MKFIWIGDCDPNLSISHTQRVHGVWSVHHEEQMLTCPAPVVGSEPMPGSSRWCTTLGYTPLTRSKVDHLNIAETIIKDFEDREQLGAAGLARYVYEHVREHFGVSMTPALFAGLAKLMFTILGGVELDDYAHDSMLFTFADHPELAACLEDCHYWQQIAYLTDTKETTT